MGRIVRRYCSQCHEHIYSGFAVKYEHGADTYEDEAGNYFDGGKCDVCGEEYCLLCGGFIFKTCKKCREQMEAGL